MLAQFAGQGVNVLGDYVLIFGKWGFPEMGIAGAAIATVASSVMTMIILMVMFFRRHHNARYCTISGWRFCGHLFRRLFSFGTASGMQLLIDAVLWTFFLLLVGCIDVVALAATSIGFRINMLAFQPIIGLGRAAASCIGKCHGAMDHAGVREYTVHCAVLCQIWMTVIALSYLFCGEGYMELFRSRDGQDYSMVMETGLNLLCFIAVYSLADGMNVAFVSALQAVGDTKWTAVVMGICTLLLIVAMCIGMKMQCGVYGLWTMATIFVIVMPIFWIFRFCGGRWKDIRVA
jgi:MATE family multidrug resistance protein